MSDFDDNTPRIFLDKEDKEAYQRQRNQQKIPKSSVETPSTEKPAKGRNTFLGVFTFLLVLGAGGACGWLWQQSEKLKNDLLDSNNRIMELEKKLSATGEEMGESTIALQTKVKQLIEKTEELWGQMDKLWASAWRRNQADIADLSKEIKQVSQPISELKKRADGLESDLGLNNTSIAALQEQLTNLKTAQDIVKRELEQALQSQDRNGKQISDVNGKLTNAILNNQTMANRLNKLETELKRLSQSSSAPVASSNPQ